MVKRVVIDCDPGVDDTMALLLALSYDVRHVSPNKTLRTTPKIHIEGITIVMGNNPSCLKLAQFTFF